MATLPCSVKECWRGKVVSAAVSQAKGCGLEYWHNTFLFLLFFCAVLVVRGHAALNGATTSHFGCRCGERRRQGMGQTRNCSAFNSISDYFGGILCCTAGVLGEPLTDRMGLSNGDNIFGFN
jgi:hypothetical protein